jgi:CMP-N,N'-diacetyllegionaminic acid synthase
MSNTGRALAVIPARGGSKGLPGKNIRSFAGLPLIAHSILFAKMCPEITRCIVSTDSPEIADVARQHGADVPFMRPQELAEDSSPLFPVLGHALAFAEGAEQTRYDYVVLLDPTSPARDPEDIRHAFSRLRDVASADGVVSVSEPHFNPIWHCVTEKDGWMTELIPSGQLFERRQDVPRVFRINGALYVWRAAFVRSVPQSWRASGKHLTCEIPELRAMSIDTLEEFRHAELLVESGLVNLPWKN